jgi:hypothetical protein
MPRSITEPTAALRNGCLQHTHLPSFLNQFEWKLAFFICIVSIGAQITRCVAVDGINEHLLFI